MIELTQGQQLPLVRDDGTAYEQLRLGLGWDKERNAGFIGSGRPNVDLDATAVQFAGDQLFDLAFYNNLSTRDGSVVHLGDNQTGAGEGDDEQLTLDLAKVYHRVDTIVLMVSSYQGHSLEWVATAYCRLLDGLGDDAAEVARYTLTAGPPETGVVMAKLTRDGAGWTLHTIGRGIAAKVPTDAIDLLRTFV
jgi:stress response protein SCP2